MLQAWRLTAKTVKVTRGEAEREVEKSCAKRVIRGWRGEVQRRKAIIRKMVEKMWGCQKMKMREAV